MKLGGLLSKSLKGKDSSEREEGHFVKSKDRPNRRGGAHHHHDHNAATVKKEGWRENLFGGGPNVVIKKQKEFRKIFGFPEDEEIVASYHCSMKSAGFSLLQGTLYLTNKHVCFYSNFLGTERKETIALKEIKAIEKKSTARIIPNALEITVMPKGEEKEKKYLFGTFLNRHEAYKLLERLWKNKQLYTQSLEVSRMTSGVDFIAQSKLAMSKIAERYEVGKALGEGGFGKAFVVLDKYDFRQYVLKQMKCESEEEAVDAVKEMVLLRLLKHPYIVAYKDFWRENMSVYIVMEYCEGGDLGQLIDKHKIFPEQQILRWLVQSCLAIEHMHNHSTLHRDIKPSNLFLNKWNDVKLGDFGLSTVCGSAGKKELAVGTLGYAAPEILRHKPYDAKSDIYALGCTLYEIITNRSVYDDQNAGLFPVPLSSDYSKELERLMLSMIDRNPDKRPTASDILEQPFLAATLEKVNVEAEIYAELQQREDENQQMQLKLELLEKKLKREKQVHQSKENEGTKPPLQAEPRFYGDISIDAEDDDEEYSPESPRRRASVSGDSGSVIVKHFDESDNEIPTLSSTRTTEQQQQQEREREQAEERQQFAMTLLLWLPIFVASLGFSLGVLGRILARHFGVYFAAAICIGAAYLTSGPPRFGYKQKDQQQQRRKKSSSFQPLVSALLSPILPSLVLYGSCDSGSTSSGSNADGLFLALCFVILFCASPILYEHLWASLLQHHQDKDKDKRQQQQYENSVVITTKRVYAMNIGLGTTFALMCGAASSSSSSSFFSALATSLLYSLVFAISFVLAESCIHKVLLSLRQRLPRSLRQDRFFPAVKAAAFAAIVLLSAYSLICIIHWVAVPLPALRSPVVALLFVVVACATVAGGRLLGALQRQHATHFSVPSLTFYAVVTVAAAVVLAHCLVSAAFAS
ncbi:Serine/threonine-protein kinase Nek1 [Balamuthia mandrillaris]